MSSSFTYHAGTLVLVTSAWVSCAGIAQAQSTDSLIGRDIVNVATISYSDGNVTSSFQTNAAVFTIDAASDPEPVEIEFFRYSPNAPSPLFVPINGSDYSPNGNLDGPFTSVGSPITSGGAEIDLSGPTPLIPATTYLSGELMFVRVQDATANSDPDAIDTVAVEITTDAGDTITLLLYESGPNTGKFWGYVQSAERRTDRNDNILTTANNTQLTATYINTFSQSDVTVDTALVNPSNVVFNSVTREPVDGARITLINAATGQVAAVYGVDGFSTFPSTVISGETVEDQSNLIYEMQDGAFRFPNAEAGEYIIQVEPPEGYTFASSLMPSAFSNSQGGFVITEASYGRRFKVETDGPLRFDIPLDPQTDLILSKSADRTYGDVGDFINYTVVIQNTGTQTTPILLHDTLPVGFRYTPGTSRLEMESIDDPEVSDDATLLTFPMGMLSPGQTLNLSYALEIGPGAAMGDAINRAVVVDGSGTEVSNIGRARVQLHEDLLRTRSTIVGRVSENSCDGDEDWAREIRKGDGIEGVRLYMETGAYAISDPDGLYHFEGVKEGTHVVQVDKETLPRGFEVMTCEENTRYAGKASSKFVEVQGGGIWRANFYLKRTDDYVAKLESESLENVDEYEIFDNDWLTTQSPDAEWVYPSVGRTPALPSTHVGIKHGPKERISLTLNGLPVAASHIAAKDTNFTRTASITRFRGIDLEVGDNEFIATIKDSDGNIVRTLKRNVPYIKTIARASALPDQSILVADGQTVPEIAVRLEDEAGRPVHFGRMVEVNLEGPYRLYDETGASQLDRDSESYVSPLSANRRSIVGHDGIMRLKLEPTLQTGKVSLTISLDNGRQIPLYMYLEPEKRDWIVVGLAEGTLGYETVKDKAIDMGESDSSTLRDGRLAFFAKGLIKGEWLMTLAVDTDTRRGDRDGDFANEIDPNAYYTLYGDRSYQEFEASTRYPLYVKLEKRTAYAMFGDYDTNVTEGRLTAYNRRLSGLKAEYLGENLQVLGFVAETNQGFAKDEIAADGTSGIYQLTNERILAQSEEIVIETRDRFRPDVVLQRRPMIRFLDYTLDYLTGELIFRLPVDVSDPEFNPNVIVVDYETSEETERNITLGGRVQTQVMNDRVQIGSTIVQQDGSALNAGSKQLMAGVDMIAQVTDNTELRVEYAVTDTKTPKPGSTSEAYLAEVVHTSEKISAEAYFREEEGGFGLGQRDSKTNGVRRYGASANVLVDQFENAETGRRGTRTIEAEVYREENLTTGDQRTTGEVLARHAGPKLSVAGGLRMTKDEYTERDDRESMLAVARASYRLQEHGLTLQASLEQPLGGKDDVSAFPQRATIGVDKTLGAKTTATIRHEIISGSNTAKSQNTTVGLSTTPWQGAAITASSDLLTDDSTRRLGATIGVDQQVKISDTWSMSLGARNRNIIDQEGEYVEVAPDAAISPFETNEDFKSGYVGLAYRDDKMSASVRGEFRDSSDGETLTGTFGVARELSEDLSLAGAVRAFSREISDTDQKVSQIDGRVGAAWRPRDEDLIIFNRLDVSKINDEVGVSTTKVVNNLAANAMLSDRLQVSGNYGVKYVESEIQNTDLSGFSHLLGGEARFDITKRIDIGLHGSVLMQDGFDRATYSYGPSIGITPADNVWVSLGYNVEGYTDDDFEASEFSRKGLYLKLRLKFDEDTARGLLRRISPAATTSEAARQTQNFSTP